jgi:DNA invertase Pin-like site-specific DNA recombinase
LSADFHKLYVTKMKLQGRSSIFCVKPGPFQFERQIIRQRQLEGILKAKQAGKYRGRQSTMAATQVKAIRERATAGENKSALAREFGITRQTVYNILSAGG